MAEFNSSLSYTALVGVNDIEFPEEVLVGSWINANPNPQITRAYKPEQDGHVIIEVVIPEEFEEEASGNPTQTWAIVDTTDPNYTYDFVVVR